MARKAEGGGTNVGNGRSFKEFLAAAPSLDEAASDDSVELSGLVSRTGEGRFAISTHEGQTYELDVEAVREFRELEGAASAATIRVGRDVLEKAVRHPIKPLVKDAIKDPIKEIIKEVIFDGKHAITDPLVDKNLHKELITDPGTDKFPPHDKHPPLDTAFNKDIHKDPLSDPLTQVQEAIGTGGGDPIFTPGHDLDPGFNPAAAAAAAPFVMATPHQAPAHLLSLQAGVQAAPGLTPQTLAITDLHPKRVETLKEAIHDTRKELIPETYKELILDTHKEIYETLVEGGPYTTVEGNPGFPGQGFPGQPGFLG